MTFFDQLHLSTSNEREALVRLPVIRDALSGQIDIETYVAFLGEAYHHVKHTVPLLMACGASLPERLEWLREAVAEYIEEEIGHQRWILDDIRACGFDAEEVRVGRPGLATELMVSYAYDSIRRIHPVSLFGMVFVLEGTSISLATRAAESLREQLGLPAAATTYLRSHGSLDEKHMLFFEQLMNRVSEVDDQRAIVHSARVFYRLYADIFRQLDASSVQRKAA